MQKIILCSLVVLSLTSMAAHAKTASEVFESVSASIVVVKTFDSRGQETGLGSGVVLGEGVIVTNCHVIEGTTKFQVVLGKNKYMATSRHSDWERDVCTLSVKGLKAPAVNKGSTSRLKVGARVYAIGAPQGLELTLSEGIISSLRPVDSGQYLQITAPISPGSSGGGLFDENGRLIGLPTFYFAKGQQLNFAVPVEWISELPNRHQVAQIAQAMTDWRDRGAKLEAMRDWPTLQDHALKWTKAEPENNMAWFALGLAYRNSFQNTKAIDALRQALHLNPELSEAWYNLGIAYAYLGHSAEELEAYHRALRIDPDYAEAWSNLGYAYGQLGQYTKAIEAYQQALRADSGDANSWNGLGTAFGRFGQTAKAIEAFQRSLSIEEENTIVWFNLGAAYKKSGQRGKAMEVYKRLKTLDLGSAERFFDEIVLP